jgi:MSHA biogenesis protein MshO
LKSEPGTRNPERVTPGARRLAPGVTLVEMIVVIAITGIIAAAVTLFIRRPMEGYIDAARRAELTDIADTALRRITRDLRTALPNSIRITESGGVFYLEYLQTSGGGRYRAEVDSGGMGDFLDFTTADTSFDVIGPMPTFAAGDSIVIYNLHSDPTITTSNAYGGDNRGTDASAAGANVTFTAPPPPPGKGPPPTPTPFPAPSPGKRFQVVQHAVTYECNPGAGELRRHWGYPIQLSPQPAPPAGGSTALLASSISACSFTYTTSGATQRTGVVALSLAISQSGETVRLFQQVHVSNVP